MLLQPVVLFRPTSRRSNAPTCQREAEAALLLYLFAVFVRGLFGDELHPFGLARFQLSNMFAVISDGRSTLYVAPKNTCLLMARKILSYF